VPVPDDTKELKVSIYDIIGNKIYNKKFVKSGKEFAESFNLSTYSPGLYFIKVEYNNNAWMKKIIIK